MRTSNSINWLERAPYPYCVVFAIHVALLSLLSNCLPAAVRLLSLSLSASSWMTSSPQRVNVLYTLGLDTYGPIHYNFNLSLFVLSYGIQHVAVKKK